MQCTATARRTGETCQMEALEGGDRCGMHDEMPSNHNEVRGLRRAASRLGQVVISRESYGALLGDSERLKQKEAKGRGGVRVVTKAGEK